MLEIQRIRENRNHFILGLAKRNVKNSESIINKLIETDDKRKILKTNSDKILSKYNATSKEIGIYINKGNPSKIQRLKKNNVLLKEKSKKLNLELKSVETEIYNQLINIYNLILFSYSIID